MKMQAKKNNFLFIGITSLLILAVLTSIGFYISRPQSQAAAGNSVAQPVRSSQAEKTNLLTSQPSTAVLSQTVGDVTVEVTYAKIIPTGFEIGLCYTTVDGGDWYAVPEHLFYSTYEIYPDEFGFTTETKANGENPGRRCEFVRYRIDDLASITTPIQFSVSYFHAEPLEMYSLCQNFQHRLDTNPKAKAYGLRAKCTENSDGSIAVELTDHSKSVPNDKAKKTLDDIASGVVNGPWEFTITELEK